MASQRYEVYFMPWAPFDWDEIGGELRVGRTVFRPFSDEIVKDLDTQVADFLRLLFNQYRDLYNNPVKTITVCHYDPEHRGLLEPLSDEQIKELASTIDVLIFCSVWDELRGAFAEGGRIVPPPNSETFEWYGQSFAPDPFEGEPMVTLVVHGLWHMEELRKLHFQIPMPAHHRGMILPNRELLALLNEMFSDTFSADLRDRLLRSLRWFRIAHKRVQDVDAETQIVQIATAFETLLNLQEERGKKRAFVKSIESWVKETWDDKVEPARDPSSDKYTTAAGQWAWEFYELRNKIVHEGVDPEEELLYPTVDCYGRLVKVTQLDVASLVFGALLIREIDEETQYVHSSARSWSELSPEDLKLMNYLYKNRDWGVRSCLERLGWVRPHTPPPELAEILREEWTKTDDALGGILSSEQIIAERSEMRGDAVKPETHKE
ncbi:hypothetical protein DCOP10_119314 [Armatimonadetes bacterium DC]|nr:hypothetical protein DCOP10_119314 [Armatimonadetes bacterium DC]